MADNVIKSNDHVIPQATPNVIKVADNVISPNRAIT